MLLAKEKEFTRARDALSAERREMRLVKIDKLTSSTDRKAALADLFNGKSQ